MNSSTATTRKSATSRTMTLDTYGHVFDELDRGERLSAEELIRAARQSQRSLDTNSRSLWALESVLGQEHG